jgi:hypothetical protein
MMDTSKFMRTFGSDCIYAVLRAVLLLDLTVRAISQKCSTACRYGSVKPTYAEMKARIIADMLGTGSPPFYTVNRMHVCWFVFVRCIETISLSVCMNSCNLSRLHAPTRAHDDAPNTVTQRLTI